MARLAASVHQRWTRLIQRRTLPVEIGLILEGIEDLHFISIHQIHAAGVDVDDALGDPRDGAACPHDRIQAVGVIAAGEGDGPRGPGRRGMTKGQGAAGDGSAAGVGIGSREDEAAAARFDKGQIVIEFRGASQQSGEGGCAGSSVVDGQGY